MSPRLKTKCALASATVHGLLLAMLVVGSAFTRPPEPKETIRRINLVRDAQITDGPTEGGGNPNVASVAQPPAAQPAAIQEPISQPPIVQPIVEPPKPTPPQPEPPKAQVQKDPVKKPPKPDPIKQTKITPPKTQEKVEAKKTGDRKTTDKRFNPKATEVAKKPVDTKPDLDLSVHKQSTDPNAVKRRQEERDRAIKEEQRREQQQRAREEAAARDYARQQQAIADAAMARAAAVQAQRVAALNGIVGNVVNKMSSGTVVEMPGPGGEAFINYADFIWAKYYNAWQQPDDHSVRSPVKVEIVVTRDGRIISSNIVSPSGDSSLDRSVRQALDRVRTLPPFPEGARDAQRTFTIQFILKSKRNLG